MMLGVASGCAFALLVVWCVMDYSRPVMYRGSGLVVVSIVLTLVMAAEIAAPFSLDSRGSEVFAKALRRD